MICVVIVVTDGDEPVPALGEVDAPVAVAVEAPEAVVSCAVPVGVPCAAKYEKTCLVLYLFYSVSENEQARSKQEMPLAGST